MDSRPIIQDLPDSYAALLPEEFQTSVPVEKFATCHNCVMATPSSPLGSCRTSGSSYSPHTKCCTYFPSLPNYLVGAILEDAETSDDIRERLVEMIAAKVGISPAGVYPSRTYHALCQRSREQGFGRSISLLCPYYIRESGLCGIWKHRDAVCSTFFCKHVGGHSGREFWDSIRNYLQHVERQLSLHAMMALQLTSWTAVAEQFMSTAYIQGKLTANDLDGNVDSAQYERLWGEWAGDELRFYRECNAAVRQLDRATFKAVCGIEHDLRVALVSERAGRLNHVPERLTRRDRTPLRREGDVYRVRLPEAAVDISVPVGVLERFDGSRDTTVVRQEVEESLGLVISRELIIALIHGGILLPAGPVPLASGCPPISPALATSDSP